MRSYSLLLEVGQSKNRPENRLPLPNDYLGMALMGFEADECLQAMTEHRDASPKTIMLANGYGLTVTPYIKEFVCSNIK